VLLTEGVPLEGLFKVDLRKKMVKGLVFVRENNFVEDTLYSGIF
jgi:hypothetical protein